MIMMLIYFFYLKHDHKYIPVKLKFEVLIWFLQL